MNFWTKIGLIAFAISLIAFIASVIRNRYAKFLDQIGPWIFCAGISIAMGSLPAGILLRKIPDALLISKILFIVITAAMAATLWIKLVETSPNTEIILIQDPIWGKPNPATGIKKYLLVKAGVLFIRLPHTIKPAGVTGIKLQRDTTTPVRIRLEPISAPVGPSGPATLEGMLSLTIEKDPDQFNLYSEIKLTEIERTKYVLEVLERRALSEAGSLAKSSWTGDSILADTNGFAAAILERIEADAANMGVKVKLVLLSQMDYDEPYRKSLGDTAAAKTLLATALALAGCTSFPKGKKGEEMRRHWTTQAQLATGIGDVRKDILDIQGLQGLTGEEGIRLAAEAMARRTRGGGK